MFPHQLEARDIALEAVCGLGSLKAHGGKLLPEVLDFYADFFSHQFCMFSECKCVLLQFFFFTVAFVLRRECIFKNEVK